MFILWNDGDVMFTVNEMAKRLNVKTDTIRYYEKMNLISSERGENGYRYFPEEMLKRTQFIFSMKDLGFTLNEIRSILEIKHEANLTCSDIGSLLKKKKEEVQQKLHTLNSIYSALDALTDLCEDDLKSLDCPILDQLEKIGSHHG